MAAGQGAFRPPAERRHPAGRFRDGLQVFDQRPTLIVGEQRSNDAVSARAVLERVTGVRVSRQLGIHQEFSGCAAGIQSHPDRIELAPDVEFLRALLGRDQHLVEVGHRAVVHEWRRSPNSVARRGLVDAFRRLRQRVLAIAMEIGLFLLGHLHALRVPFREPSGKGRSRVRPSAGSACRATAQVDNCSIDR